jgi:hypothetical protein
VTTKRRSNVQPWAAAVEDILADGDWHDGRRALIQGMKLIEPGVAQRAAEKERTQRTGAPADRARRLPVEEQIRIGKRRMMANVVAGRLRNGYWESDPPYPLGNIWAGPDFKLRDTRATLLSMSQIATYCQVPVGTVQRVFDSTSVKLHRRGKNRFIAKSDLELIANEVKAWVADARTRKGESTRKAMRTRAALGRNLFTPTTLAAIDSVLGPDPETPARDRLVKLAEQASEAEQLRTALWICRDELARQLEAHAAGITDKAGLRVLETATRALDLTGGLFRSEGKDR